MTLLPWLEQMEELWGMQFLQEQLYCKLIMIS